MYKRENDSNTDFGDDYYDNDDDSYSDKTES